MSELPRAIHDLPCSRIALAVGIFDGVHRGHQAIIQQLLAIAEATHAEPVALFFAPHPKAVLFGEQPPYLTNPKQKAGLLHQAGAAQVVCMPFTRELAALSPQAFLEGLLSGTPAVTGFCVGENWRFGNGNLGKAQDLASWCADHGLACQLVKQVCHDGDAISSTRIRHAIQAGELAEAAAMLGRPVSICGTVRHGLGLAGRELQCPTANLQEPGQILPPNGVYAASATWEGRHAFGIVYVGDAPTIRSGQPEIITELHLFDLEEVLYGKEVTISFQAFIRPSLHFSSPQALQQQIEQDIRRARTLQKQGLPSR